MSALTHSLYIYYYYYSLPILCHGCITLNNHSHHLGLNSVSGRNFFFVAGSLGHCLDHPGPYPDHPDSTVFSPQILPNSVSLNQTFENQSERPRPYKTIRQGGGGRGLFLCSFPLVTRNLNHRRWSSVPSPVILAGQTAGSRASIAPFPRSTSSPIVFSVGAQRAWGQGISRRNSLKQATMVHGHGGGGKNVKTVTKGPCHGILHFLHSLLLISISDVV